MPDLVHPDYTELVREHLRRALAGEPGLDRLEVELQPRANSTARVELSAVRIDYQGGPALLLTLVEMGPRAALVAAGVAPGRRRGKRSTRSVKASSPPMSAAASTTSTRPASN